MIFTVLVCILPFLIRGTTSQASWDDIPHLGSVMENAGTKHMAESKKTKARLEAESEPSKAETEAALEIFEPRSADLDDFNTIFKAWKKQFKNVPEVSEISDIEGGLNGRRKTFRKAFKEVAAHNDKYDAGSAMGTRALNQFSIMTEEEMKSFLRGIKEDRRRSYTLGAKGSKASQNSALTKVSFAAVSQTFDWRIFDTSIKNQGSCGSCTTFAVTAVLDNWAAKVSGSKVNTSPQELLNCVDENMDICSNGYYTEKVMEYARKKGVTTWDEEPYFEKQYNCSSGKRRYVKTYGFTTKRAWGQNFLADSLTKGAVTVDVKVYHDFFSIGRSGIYETNGQHFIGYHAMAAVGMTPSYWIVKNSWGTSWGRSGYAYIKRTPANDAGHIEIARNVNAVTSMQMPNRGMDAVTDLDCEIENSGGVPTHHLNGNLIGWFDVTSGTDAEGEKGHWNMLLGEVKNYAYASTYVVKDVRLVSSNWPKPSCPSGYTRRCWWDLYGNSYGTDGSKGHWDTSLCVKREQCASGSSQVVTEVIAMAGNDGTAEAISGYSRIGFFDVDGGGGTAVDTATSGHWIYALYIKKEYRSC